MQISEIINLNEKLSLITQQLSLLEFWKDNPEIQRISIECHYEYGDEGDYFPNLSISDIEFVSEEVAKVMLKRYFPTSIGEAEKVNANNYRDIDTLDMCEWDEVLSFTSTVILKPEDETYVRPKNVEEQMSHLQQEIHSQFVKCIHDIQAYAVLEPEWEYNDEYFFTSEGTRIIGVYLSKEEAEELVTDINLKTVATHSWDDIYTNGNLTEENNPDYYSTLEEKLTVWKEHASNYLAFVQEIKIK